MNSINLNNNYIKDLADTYEYCKLLKKPSPTKLKSKYSNKITLIATNVKYVNLQNESYTDMVKRIETEKKESSIERQKKLISKSKLPSRMRIAEENNIQKLKKVLLDRSQNNSSITHNSQNTLANTISFTNNSRPSTSHKLTAQSKSTLPKSSTIKLYEDIVENKKSRFISSFKERKEYWEKNSISPIRIDYIKVRKRKEEEARASTPSGLRPPRKIPNFRIIHEKNKNDLVDRISTNRKPQDFYNSVKPFQVSNKSIGNFKDKFLDDIEYEKSLIYTNDVNSKKYLSDAGLSDYLKKTLNDTILTIDSEKLINEKKNLLLRKSLNQSKSYENYISGVYKNLKEKPMLINTYDDNYINNIKPRCKILLKIYLDLVNDNVKDPLGYFNKSDLFYLKYYVKSESLEGKLYKINDKFIKLNLDYNKLKEKDVKTVEHFIERKKHEEEHIRDRTNFYDYYNFSYKPTIKPMPDIIKQQQKFLENFRDNLVSQRRSHMDIWEYNQKDFRVCNIKTGKIKAHVIEDAYYKYNPEYNYETEIKSTLQKNLSQFKCNNYKSRIISKTRQLISADRETGKKYQYYLVSLNERMRYRQLMVNTYNKGKYFNDQTFNNLYKLKGDERITNETIILLKKYYGEFILTEKEIKDIIEKVNKDRDCIDHKSIAKKLINELGTLNHNKSKKGNKYWYDDDEFDLERHRLIERHHFKKIYEE